jgi:hypothetical protein
MRRSFAAAGSTHHERQLVRSDHDRMKESNAPTQAE